MKKQHPQYQRCCRVPSTPHFDDHLLHFQMRQQFSLILLTAKDDFFFCTSFSEASKIEGVTHIQTHTYKYTHAMLDKFIQAAVTNKCYISEFTKQIVISHWGNNLMGVFPLGQTTCYLMIQEPRLPLSLRASEFSHPGGSKGEQTWRRHAYFLKILPPK